MSSSHSYSQDNAGQVCRQVCRYMYHYRFSLSYVSFARPALPWLCSMAAVPLNSHPFEVNSQVSGDLLKGIYAFAT